jgi:SNF2 family DNA or RNA helicase
MNRNDLHPYQWRGHEEILNKSHCGLFLDMGLGKTVTTLTAISDLIYERLEVDRVLVVAPKRVAESVWIQEAQKWEHLRHLRFSLITGSASKRQTALKKDADVYLVSRDNIAWLCGLFGGSKLPFDMLVIDELSSFKNHASVRFKALKLVQSSFSRIVGLTGTPAPNGLIDLWAQIWLLDRGERLGKTITAYRESFFNRAYSGFGYDIRSGSSEDIHQRIGDIVVSMKAEDYLDLPKRITNIVRIGMSDELKRQYKEFEREKVLELFEAGETITAANAAALTNKLLQFANGAVYDSQKEVHHVHDLKLEALEDIVEAAQGAPILVAWAYKSDADRIERHFKKLKPRRLGGDADVLDWNAGKIPMMLMHPASGGHGLNLQKGGHIVVWFGNTWSLELVEQFNARVDRQGQTKTPIIYILAIAGTMDERVIDVVDGKSETQSHLMDAVKLTLDEYRR